jgi:hypothetical protein
VSVVPVTWEAEAEDCLSLGVCGQPSKHNKTLSPITYMWPGTVDQVCNPSYLGGRDQEDHGLRPAWGKKLSRLHLNQWVGTVAIQGGTNRRIIIQAGPIIK